jgi:hypothetical protein
MRDQQALHVPRLRLQASKSSDREETNALASVKETLSPAYEVQWNSQTAPLAGEGFG